MGRQWRSSHRPDKSGNSGLFVRMSFIRPNRQVRTRRRPSQRATTPEMRHQLAPVTVNVAASRRFHPLDPDVLRPLVVRGLQVDEVSECDLRRRSLLRFRCRPSDYEQPGFAPSPQDERISGLSSEPVAQKGRNSGKASGAHSRIRTSWSCSRRWFRASALWPDGAHTRLLGARQ